MGISVLGSGAKANDDGGQDGELFLGWIAGQYLKQRLGGVGGLLG